MQFNIDLVYSILASTLRSSVPLILASMGGCFSMRAGVSDLGLEGMMLAGSFFAVLGSWISGNAWIGLLTGILFGAVFSMLHAVMHISYKVNASISGMCVNLLASAVTPLLLNVIFGGIRKAKLGHTPEDTCDWQDFGSPEHTVFPDHTSGHCQLDLLI